MAATPRIAATLDITRDICPITFVKTKLELEDLRPGDLLEVFLREGEPLANVVRSCEEEGHAVVERVRRDPSTWRLVVRRGADA